MSWLKFWRFSHCLLMDVHYQDAYRFYADMEMLCFLFPVFSFQLSGQNSYSGFSNHCAARSICLISLIHCLTAVQEGGNWITLHLSFCPFGLNNLTLLHLYGLPPVMCKSRHLESKSTPLSWIQIHPLLSWLIVKHAQWRVLNEPFDLDSELQVSRGLLSTRICE